MSAPPGIRVKLRAQVLVQEMHSQQLELPRDLFSTLFPVPLH